MDFNPAPVRFARTAAGVGPISGRIRSPSGIIRSFTVIRANISSMVECDPPPVSNTTGRMVFCQKFQKEMPGLDAPPWPGELGQRVYENISAEAWKMWEERMKMILNEYRLMPWQKEAQEIVVKHMEDFFFGESAALPPGYVPQQAK
jgi:Fe-S cluster biosynthesis and repair protein YggX